MRLQLLQPDWVKQAHDLDDDVDSNDAELFAQLAGVVESWPAQNQVVRKALHAAAMELVAQARASAADHPVALPS